MAEIQEFEEVVGDEIGEIEAEAQKPAPTPVPEPTVDDDIPPEYRGLSQAELARKLKHSYREMGRQANELGEIRKLADELIKTQLKPTKVQEEQPKEVDFFENPQEAINRAVASNPEVQAAKQFAVQAQQEMLKRKLQEIHPDVGQLMGDQEFGQWVMSSPYRQKLLKQADAYDLEAANELFSTFKEIRAAKVRQTVAKTSEVEQSEREASLRSAAVDTGGSGEVTKKVYRRADLIRLKMRDPERYEAMNDEILQAYAEGRVR
jgi:hypothetical protein